MWFRFIKLKNQKIFIDKCESTDVFINKNEFVSFIQLGRCFLILAGSCVYLAHMSPTICKNKHIPFLWFEYQSGRCVILNNFFVQSPFWKFRTTQKSKFLICDDISEFNIRFGRPNNNSLSVSNIGDCFCLLVSMDYYCVLGQPPLRVKYYLFVGSA